MSTITYLTADQEKMVSLLIIGENITNIAKKLNVSRQTVYDWMKKENIKSEIDRRRDELAEEGNRLILKDVTTYIENIKALAKDKSDKRVCLAANQYLLNRIYGNPSSSVEFDDKKDENLGISENELETELNKFKKITRLK